MPYPSQFPYELLEASPEDPVPILQKKWGEAIRKRRDQNAALRHAFDELKNPRLRLGYDFLLIIDLPTATDTTKVVQTLAQQTFLTSEVESLPITLALTDLVSDHSASYRTISFEERPVNGAEEFASVPVDAIAVVFDC